MKGFSNSAVALVLLAVAGAASADALSDCYKTRTAGPVSRDFAEANKAFDLYLRRQCGFESAMSGSGTSAGNQYIACRINLMKLRMGALGNFSGPASPDPSGK